MREIGYADFGHSPYILYIYIDNETDQGDVATIKKLYNTLLTDSNIEMNIVNVDDNLASGAIEHFNNHNIKSYPSAQLVLHDNKAMSYPIYDPGKSLIESVWLLFENLASSSKRNLIKERLLEAFCVVLIIEGKNQIQNSYVLSETQKAVEEISQRFEYMPKTKCLSVRIVLSLSRILKRRFIL